MWRPRRGSVCRHRRYLCEAALKGQGSCSCDQLPVLGSGIKDTLAFLFFVSIVNRQKFSSAFYI